MKIGLLGSKVARPNPQPQSLLVVKRKRWARPVPLFLQSVVGKFIGEARPLGLAKHSAATKSELVESSQSVYHDLCRRYNSRQACWRSSASRVREMQPSGQNPNRTLNSQSLLMKTLLLQWKMQLHLIGPEQVAPPAQPQQQSLSLLVKCDLLRWQSARVPRGPRGPHRGGHCEPEIFMDDQHGLAMVQLASLLILVLVTNTELMPLRCSRVQLPHSTKAVLENPLHAFFFESSCVYQHVTRVKFRRQFHM